MHYGNGGWAGCVNTTPDGDILKFLIKNKEKHRANFTNYELANNYVYNLIQVSRTALATGWDVSTGPGWHA